MAIATRMLATLLIAIGISAGLADRAAAQLTSDEELAVENEVVLHIGGGLRSGIFLRYLRRAWMRPTPSK